ncbi:MAG: NAD(P)-dependent oxidoreductase [Acidimicrobiales bacterium]
MRIGFIGLGNMGGPMAGNLVKAGHDVAAFDVDPVKVQLLAREGAQPADSVAEAARGAHLVMTSLPGPMQIRAVAEQLIPTMDAGAVWVELSTNDLDCAHELGRAASEAGIGILDAPVSGGWEGAEAGTLTVLVGGTDETFEAARPTLEVIGSKIEHLGPHGAGYVAKISQVMLCYLNSVCMTEALMLGVKGGVDPAKMLDIIQNSTGRSYVADRYGPELLNGGYDDTFDLGLALKDLKLGMSLASSTGAHLPFTDSVTKLYEEAEELFGFSAPHLIAMQMIERNNDLILHHSGEPQ